MKPRSPKAEHSHDSRPGRLRLLSYIRVSAVRGREGPGFISPSDQAQRNRGYAQAYGHTIVEEGEDLDRSGGDMSRPTFDRFLEMIRRGEADGIIVAKLDRFARSNKGALEAIEEIEKHGGVLISVSEQIDPSTASGRFLRNILLATAQMERDRIGEQWLTARINAVERGIHISHHVPPGYVRGPKTNDPRTDRRLKPHRVHAKTIAEAFRMAAAGESDSAIADYLTARKLPVTAVGKDGKGKEKPTHWQSFRVPRLLANRAYLGEARSGSGIVKPHAHKALVDEETWLLAQNRPRTPRLRKPSRTAEAPPSILSGIVRCAGCSFAMKPQGAGKTSPALYRCIKSSVHGVCPSPAVVTKQRLEDYVIEQFLDVADAYLVGSVSDADTRRQLAEAEAAEQRYRAALVNVELRAKIGDDDHDRMVASLYDDWQGRRAAVEETNVVSPLAPASGISLRDFVERLREDGKSGELRSLLGEGIEAVFVRRAQSKARNLPVADRVHIVWRGSEEIKLPKRGRRFAPRAYVW